MMGDTCVVVERDCELRSGLWGGEINEHSTVCPNLNVAGAGRFVGDHESAPPIFTRFGSKVSQGVHVPSH